MFGKNLNELKFHSEKNEHEIEVGECLLLFGAESFVLFLLSKNIKD
jgi:hypothetical protein